MATKQRSTSIAFWIPFAGKNKDKFGTRIIFTVDPDPNQSSFYISRLPEKQQAGDIRISNGGAGMQEMYLKLHEHVPGDAKQLWLYFNVVSELIIGWQQKQRGD